MAETNITVNIVIKVVGSDTFPEAEIQPGTGQPPIPLGKRIEQAVRAVIEHELRPGGRL